MQRKNHGNCLSEYQSEHQIKRLELNFWDQSLFRKSARTCGAESHLGQFPRHTATYDFKKVIWLPIPRLGFEYRRG
jgi:hypothetical protein